MNKPLVFFLCTLASGVVLAQAVAPGHAASDRSARKAEMQARAQARFAQSDRNHDGRISLAEFQDASDKKLAERFARMDANKDGQLTQEEMRLAHEQRRGKMMERREGRREGRREHRRERMEKLQALDTNKDQALSRAEIGTAMPRLLEHFDQLDTNHDGKLTRDEMRAGRQAARQQAH